MKRIGIIRLCGLALLLFSVLCFIGYFVTDNNELFQTGNTVVGVAVLVVLADLVFRFAQKSNMHAPKEK